MKQLLFVTSALALAVAAACSRTDTAQNDSIDTADLDADEQRVDLDADGVMERLVNGYTDQHEWVNAGVYIGDERVAEIERVHFDGETIDAVVIELGGIADLGGREVELNLDQAELTPAPGGAPRFQLDITKAELDSLPDFDESRASTASTSSSHASPYDSAAFSTSSAYQPATMSPANDGADRSAGAESMPRTPLAANESRADIDGDGDLETLVNGYTDDHHWVNAGVYIGVDRVAEIERVHFNGDEIDGLVAETGGVGDLGGREVALTLRQAQVTNGANGQPRFDLAMTKAQFEALPDFDESEASNAPFSDNPLDDHESDDGSSGSRTEG